VVCPCRRNLGLGSAPEITSSGQIRDQDDLGLVTANAELGPDAFATRWAAPVSGRYDSVPIT
jgi:hypothetical protein